MRRRTRSTVNSFWASLLMIVQKQQKNCSSCTEMRDRKLRDTTPRVRCTESHSLHRQQSNDDLHSFSWLIFLAAAAGGRLVVAQDFGPWLQWTAQSAEKMYEVHRSKFSFSLEIIFDIFIVFFFNLLKRSFSDGFKEPTVDFYKLFTMWQLQKKNVVDASELLLLCCMRECLELFVASKIVIW